MYQRTPPWLLPTENYGDPFPPEFHDLLTLLPNYGRWDRLWQFWIMHEGLLAAARVDPGWDRQTESVSDGNDFVRSMLVDVLRGPGRGRRALREDGARTSRPSPSVPCATTGGGRRRSGTPDVDLVTTPIAEITAARRADGGRRGAPRRRAHLRDGLQRVGLRRARCGSSGRGGVELNEEWGGDARAYLGITVPGFPNFFMLYGPNTNLVINGSILIMVECQVRYVVEAIGRLLRAGHRTMSCRRDVHERYGREMEEGNAQMVVGRGRRADLVPQRARAGHPELALRPPHVLGAHAGARPGRLRAGLRGSADDLDGRAGRDAFPAGPGRHRAAGCSRGRWRRRPSR